MDEGRKTGRLRDATVARVHEMRGEYDAEGRKQKAQMTYQAIATELGVAIGTIYNICKGHTHPEDHPTRRARPAPRSS